MKAGFVEKLIGRLGRIGPEEVQNYFLRLAQEKGFLETVFNAIQEGIIVTDSNGRITYLNEAALLRNCGLIATTLRRRIFTNPMGTFSTSHATTGSGRDRDVAEAVSFGEDCSVSVAELPIKIDREKIATFCRVHGIRKLSLFGSVLRDDFDRRRSDVDVLVELLPEAQPGWEFFGWHQDLAPIIGHKVDLHTANSLSKYFRDEVLREALPVYEQA